MYYAKVNWYNDYDGEDCIVHMFICAADWNEAMSKVSSQFDYINSIEMRQIDSADCSVVYVPSEFVDKIIEENEM